MDTKDVNVDELDSLFKQGWKLHGPVYVENGTLKQTVVRRYPGMYTTVVKISKSKLNTLLDVQSAVKNIVLVMMESLRKKGNEDPKDVDIEEPNEANGLSSLIQWPSFFPKMSFSNENSPGFISLLCFKPILNAIGLRRNLSEEDRKKHYTYVQYITLVFKVYVILSKLESKYSSEMIKQIDTMTDINSISKDYSPELLMEVETLFRNMNHFSLRYNVEYNFALRHILYPNIF